MMKTGTLKNTLRGGMKAGLLAAGLLLVAGPPTAAGDVVVRHRHTYPAGERARMLFDLVRPLMGFEILAHEARAAGDGRGLTGFTTLVPAVAHPVLGPQGLRHQNSIII
jgi:hypothetical protein